MHTLADKVDSFLARSCHIFLLTVKCPQSFLTLFHSAPLYLLYGAVQMLLSSSLLLLLILICNSSKNNTLRRDLEPQPD